MIQHHVFPGALGIFLVVMLVLVGELAAEFARSQATVHAADVEERTYAKIVKARGDARAGRYQEALNQLADAVDLAEQLEGRMPLALALHNKGEVERLRGRPLNALKAYRLALEVYTQVGHLAGIAIAQRRIGAVTSLVRMPAGATSPTLPLAINQDRLALIDQAVERIRLQMRGVGPELPDPPAAAETSHTEDPPPAAAEASHTEDPPFVSIEIARTKPRQAVDSARQWAYVESLKRKIGDNSRYPSYAKRTDQQGTVELAFTVQQNGELDSVELSKSSGFIVLDVETLRNVRESAPFNPVPNTGMPGPLIVRLMFKYKLLTPP